VRRDGAVEIQFSLHRGARPAAHADPSSSPASGLPGRLPRVTQVMALAIQFQDMIERGEAKYYADLARLGCLTRERMSQIMELIWLAPDIQEEILSFAATAGGRFPISELAVRRIAGNLSWEEQWTEWLRLKNSFNIPCFGHDKI
jgi:hypothetical protein